MRARLPRADVRAEIPADSMHPQSYTGRLRRAQMTSPELIARAEQRQADHTRTLDEEPAQPRH
jgi:hypothetical protein